VGMAKIPSYLNPPDNPEVLVDRVLYEWSTLGQHLDDVHRWACGGPEDPDGITERVSYLLDVLDGLSGLHPKVQEWASIARMTINCINGGSVPYRVHTPV